MAHTLRKLDPASQHSVRWMAARLCCLALLWLVPWALGMVGLEQMTAGLSLAFAVGSLLAMCVAAARKEPLGAASLNTWDEAVAFSGLAALAHAVHWMLQ